MYKDKIKNLKQLSLVVKSLKKSNKIIGFTNGCFDILHLGHIAYLEKAKNKCDILVVGVNSDNSVKKIKGGKRPINDQKSRMAVLASLESVDYVLKFDQKTPLKIIKRIKPDILIKGGDWKKEEIVGKDIITSYGGKIITFPYIKGYSTSQIIDSIKKLK